MDNLSAKDKENREFGKNLREKGHKCVIFLEMMPLLVKWCEQETCVKLSTNNKLQ